MKANLPSANLPQKRNWLMCDVFTKRKRSQVMSKIRSTGNVSTEQVFARELRSRRISGWRKHLSLPGKPDFTFLKNQVCVFLHGCFWHGCPNCYRPPSGNSKYWRKKLESNQARDRRVVRQLRKARWSVLTLWECQLTKGKINKTMAKLERKLIQVQEK